MATQAPHAELGLEAPPFTLPATDGKAYSLADVKGARGTLVMFICNHCPYVQAIENRLVQLTQELLALTAKVVAISSNDAVKYPTDSLDNMRFRAEEKNYPFPYLYDETQEVAKKFAAVCTPDFFVYDKNLKLSYRGRLDDSWKDEKLVSKHELRHAVLELLHDRPVPMTQYPSMGCNIKWK